MMRRGLVVGAWLTVCLWAGAAQAQKLVPWLEGAIGAKAFGAGNILIGPTGSVPVQPNGDEFWLFSNLRGGYGVGGGLYGEMRFIKYVGLEIGLLMAQHKVWETTDHAEDRLTIEEGYEFTTAQLSFLVEGYLPVGITRLSLGFGPELAWSFGGKTSYKATKGDIAVLDPNAELRTFLDKLEARTGMDLWLTTVMGVSVDVWRFTIPIEIRYAYNVSDKTDYLRERVRLQPPPAANLETDINDIQSVTLPARATHIIGLSVGLAYNFK